MEHKHTAARGGGGSGRGPIVDIEAWSEAARLRQSRNPLLTARRAAWRFKCWLLRNGLVSSIS